MGETIDFLKHHLADNFAVYFIVLYTFGGRPTAIIAALAVDMHIYAVVSAVVVLDTLQIPVFYYLYGAVSKRPIVRKLTTRSQAKMAHMGRSKFIRRLQYLGPPGVVTIASLPLKGCGMWSGVLLSKILRLPLSKSYALLIIGSILGCVLLVVSGEAALGLITKLTR